MKQETINAIDTDLNNLILKATRLQPYYALNREKREKVSADLIREMLQFKGNLLTLLKQYNHEKQTN